MSDLEQELRRLRDERQKKFNEEDWEGALQIHNRILELSPSALRYANQGSILYRLGHLEEAIASYRKALDMEPTLKRARADLERLEAQYQKKQSDGVEIVEPSPQSSATEIHDILPSDSKKKGTFFDGEEEGDKSKQEKAKQEKLNLLRVQRQQAINAQNWHEALQLHNQILELEPTASRYLNQGSILHRLGKIQEAVQAYRKALEMDPSLEKARIDLERLEAQLEEEKLLSAPKSSKSSDVQKRIEELRKERQVNIQQEKWDSALQKHDEILVLEPTGLRYANKGALLYRMGRLAEALECYRKALEMDPSLAKVKEEIAQLESQIEEEKLSSHFAEPHPISQEMSAEERVAKINFYKDERQKYLDAKQWDKALELHDAIIAIEPTALRYVNRGSMLYRMQRLEEAIASYRKALEMDSSLGRAQVDLDRIEKELAQKKLASIPQKPPSQQDIQAKLEELRQQRQKKIQEGNWEEALTLQDEIVALEPTGMRYATRGSILYRLGRINEAILSYRKALDLDPNLDQAKTDLKNLQTSEMERLRQERQKKMESNEWAEALQIHDIILALEPTALRYANRGSILYRMNRISESVAAYQKALELDPNLTQAKEDLARLQEEIAQDPSLQSVPAEFQEDEEEIVKIETLLDTAIPPAQRVDEKRTSAEKKTQELSKVTLQGHTGEITGMALGCNGKYLISASKDHSLRVWDLNTFQCVQVFQGHNDWIRTMSPANENQIISGSDDWTLKLWDVRNGKNQTLTGHSMPILDVATLSNQPYCCSASRDRSLRVWNLQKSSCIATLTGHNDWVSSVVFTPSGDRIISGSFDRTIRIWEVASFSCIHTIEGHSNWVQKLAITPDGQKLISIGQDRSIRLWDIASWQLIQSMEGHSGDIVDIAMTSNELVTAAHDSSVIVWNLADGTQKQVFSGFGVRFERMALSHHGLIAAATAENKTYVWELQTGNLCTVWQTAKPVSYFLFAKAQNWLISGSKDGTIQIWDCPNMER